MGLVSVFTPTKRGTREAEEAELVVEIRCWRRKRGGGERGDWRRGVCEEETGGAECVESLDLHH